LIWIKRADASQQRWRRTLPSFTFQKYSCFWQFIIKKMPVFNQKSMFFIFFNSMHAAPQYI